MSTYNQKSSRRETIRRSFFEGGVITAFLFFTSACERPSAVVPPAPSAILTDSKLDQPTAGVPAPKTEPPPGINRPMVWNGERVGENYWEMEQQSYDSFGKADMKEYFSKADAGDADAQTMVGNYYEARRDPQKAKYYFELAAKQGVLDAMNNLGYIWAGKPGVYGDKVEALKWHFIAFLTHNGKESPNIKGLVAKLTSSQVEHAEAQARRWVQDNADTLRKKQK